VLPTGETTTQNEQRKGEKIAHLQAGSHHNKVGINVDCVKTAVATTPQMEERVDDRERMSCAEKLRNWWNERQDIDVF
jgi:hypothetical protein